MKTIILIDSGRKFIAQRNKILETINLYKEEKTNIEVFDISSVNFKECIGCFNCWVKNPGLCSSDENNELNAKIIKSDNLVIISEMTYGGFSASAKRVIDKLLPNVLPHMTLINSEMHHVKRYKKYPNLLTIAYADEIIPKYVDLFTSTSIAMGRNFHSKNTKSILIDSNFDLKTLNVKLDEVLGLKEAK